VPMIDVYAPAGAFADKSQLARRVQVLTNAGALDRDKQIALVERLTALVSGAPGNPPPPARIWVLLTEAPDGGWGLWGSAHTNDELIAAARSQMAAAAEAAQAAHNGEAPGA
jgi:phenylpyruvate tautomerase PptA (4-oxalocrotonate tautomerase family)